jgi:hypothetical protein
MLTVNEKTAITMCCLSLLTIGISLPLYYGKIKQNSFYGFRLPKAFESDENWYLINAYGAKVLIQWSFAIMFMGFVSLVIDSNWVILCAQISFASVLIPIYLSFRFAKRID